jgi:hypothetical protein
MHATRKFSRNKCMICGQVFTKPGLIKWIPVSFKSSVGPARLSFECCVGKAEEL